MFGLVQPGLFVVFDDATASLDMIWTRCWSQHRTDVLDLLQNKVFDKFHGYHAPQWGQIWRKIGQAHSK